MEAMTLLVPMAILVLESLAAPLASLLALGLPTATRKMLTRTRVIPHLPTVDTGITGIKAADTSGDLI